MGVVCGRPALPARSTGSVEVRQAGESRMLALLANFGLRKTYTIRGLPMASITIRNLDEDVKARLQAQAAEHHRSIEEEVRVILRNAVAGRETGPRDLAKFTRECFAPLGGVELQLPSRGPMREPLDFS